MSREDWDDDAALLADLGGALGEDAGTPDRVADLGRTAFLWRTVDAELVELTAQESAAELVRAAGGPVLSTFTGSGVTVETERDGDVLRGQLAPPGPGQVEVIGGAAGTLSVDLSDDGYFVVRGLPPTTIRLRIRSGDGGFVTPWFGVDD